MVETELRSSARSYRALACWAICPASRLLFYIKIYFHSICVIFVEKHVHFCVCVLVRTLLRGWCGQKVWDQMDFGRVEQVRRPMNCVVVSLTDMLLCEQAGIHYFCYMHMLCLASFHKNIPHIEHWHHSLSCFYWSVKFDDNSSECSYVWASCNFRLPSPMLALFFWI